jgi:polysaccharide chain length determinant protein (PEP-CTERM system associated)
MAEEPDEQTSGGLDLPRYLDLIRRRHIHFLVPVFVGWLIVWGASWILPPRFKSVTLILVEESTMPKNYVTPNVNDDLQDRLQSITQQILSRTRLLVIIDKLHLYAERGAKASPDEKVDLMRKDIDIELVRDAQKNQITAFRVSYQARDPHIAQRVTSDLTELFIDENLKVRQQQSEDTTRFMESQLETARTNLAAQEAKVREFEGQHEGELPTQQASNLQILGGLQSQLESEQGALNTAKQQRVYLQTLIEQTRAARGTPRGVEGTPTGLAAIDQELDRLRAKLADLSSHYTDRYPDVQNVKAEIAKTERMRSEFIAEQKNRSSAGRQVNGDTAQRDATDVPESAAMLQLRGQLQSNQAEIGNREQAIATLKARINSYQERLNAGPASEQQLADLTRGYEQSKVDYDDLLKKKNESVMATSMELMQQGERFRVLDPPSLPLKPDFPNRLKFCGMGLGIGLALGVVVVGTFELLDDRLHSENGIKALLSTVIISEIPNVASIRDEQKAKRRMALGWAMAALVVATILAGSAFSYLHD